MWAERTSWSGGSALQGAASSRQLGRPKLARYGRATSWVLPTILLALAAVVASIAVMLAAGYVTLGSGPRGPPYCPLDVSFEEMTPSPGPLHSNCPGASNYSAGSVVFSASASGCTAPYSFAYSFGDGTHSNVANITHAYAGPGYYSGSLKVQASSGYSSMNYFCVNATAWPYLSVRSGNPAPACP